MPVESAPGSALFGTTRQAVLALMFANPDRRFYQRQVIESLRMGSGSVQRELERLVRAGVLTRTVEGRQRYFRANRECPIFDELRGIVRKTLGVARALEDAMSPLSKRIEVAFVFGSWASGTENADSDVDLMVIGDVSFSEVVNTVGSLQEELRREINPSVYPAKEFCRKLSEGHQFLTRVTQGPKVFLIGDADQLKRLGQVRVAERARDKPTGNLRSTRGRRA